MIKHNKNRSYLALAIAAALTSNVTFAAEEANAAAAEAEAAKSSGLEVIEVTARRTAENLQQVPVSVTSIGAEAISQNGITDVTDIQKYATNTTLQVGRGTSSTLTAYIRGIGMSDPIWGFEPGVGIYVDDVYVARPQGGVMEILDVERVEILRGPQGTLYGKNTIGGALKYVTKKMTGDNTFDVSATVGSYGENTYKGSGQLSLLDDTLYIGAALADINRDGFGNFLNEDAVEGSLEAAQQGKENYNKEIFAGRVVAEYHPTEDLFFRLAYDNTVDDSNAKGGHRLTLSNLEPVGIHDNVYDSDISLPVTNKVETSGVSFTADWNLSDTLSIKSVTAARDGDTSTFIDFDSTVGKNVDVPAVYSDEQFTQEFQLTYVGNSVTAVGGLYYYTGEACGQFDLQVFAGAVTRELGGCTDTESYAIYGQGSITLSEKWSMTLGGRYTEDTKKADYVNNVLLGTYYPEEQLQHIPGSASSEGVVPLTSSGFVSEETWSHFSPRIGVEYQASEEFMAYASYANGFKSGGFNPRADLAVDPDAGTPFDPEIADTFEIGFKSEPTDDLRINATVFYTQYSDMQITTQRGVGDSFVATVLNAGEADISGVELEATYVATEDLTLNLGVGYLNSNITEFYDVDPDTGEIGNIADIRDIPNTPDWSVNLGANYTLVADIGDFVFTANASYRGETQIEVRETITDEDAYTLVSAGVSFYHTDGNWSASLQAQNITDEQVRVAGYNFPNSEGGLVGENISVGFYNDPATFSLTVKYEF